MPHQNPEPSATESRHWEAFDLLATMVAVVDREGHCLFVNSMLESVIGLSRRTLTSRSLLEWCREPMPLKDALDALAANQFASRRFEGALRRAVVGLNEPLPVHIIVSQLDHSHSRMLVEMIELEQQTRHDREARVAGQAQVTKELIRNLAHEIQNPLGGIRGAAQLLAMELQGTELWDELAEYTQVIVHEADRLQSLVDRLLAPHRRAQVVVDVNIHEVCERVRSVVLAEYPRGLKIERDYDTSLPDFGGEREQLIQAE